MPHIGLLTLCASGHLNPMTSLGNRLASRGHTVTLFGEPDCEPHCRAAGINFVPVIPGPGKTANEMLENLGSMSGVAGLLYTIKVLTESIEDDLHDFPPVIAGAGVDLLLVDHAVFGGGTIADSLGIPFVTICNAFLDLCQEDPRRPFEADGAAYATSALGRIRVRIVHTLAYYLVKMPALLSINNFRKTHGLPILKEVPRVIFSKLAIITQQSPLFDFPSSVSPPPHAYFCGPFTSQATRKTISTPFPWDRLDGRPLIYASLGTVQNRLKSTFQTIATACSTLAVQLVISIGRDEINDFDGVSFDGDPVVVRFAPQLELLPKCTAMITHAGMNSAMECLAAGIPVVAIPVTNDQPGVAARLGWTGCGKVVPVGSVTVEKIRSAVKDVVVEKSYRENALKMRDDIEKAGGVEKAAEAVEKVLNDLSIA